MMLDLDDPTLTAPVTGQELDDWLKSTLEEEVEPAPVTLSVYTKTGPPSQPDLAENNGEDKPMRRRRSSYASLDMSSHSFGIDVQTTLMLDEIDQDTRAGDIFKSSFTTNGDDFFTPVSTVGARDVVNREAALSVEPAPLITPSPNRAAFHRSDTACSCYSGNAQASLQVSSPFQQETGFVRSVSTCPSNHSTGTPSQQQQVHHESFHQGQVQANPAQARASYQASPVQQQPVDTLQDVGHFLSAMEHSQKSQGYIHDGTITSQVSPSPRSAGLARETSRSRELLLGALSRRANRRSSAPEEVTAGGHTPRRSNQVPYRASRRSSMDVPRAGRRSSMEDFCRGGGR